MSGYFGSKAASGLFQNIIAMMPPHDTYIETHLGGGAIMKRKPPTATNIGIDLDPEALSNFKCEYPVQLINACAHDFLSHRTWTGSELIYCDPPYLLETRTSQRRYRFEYTKQNHIKLLEQLNRLSCQVIVSGYPSTLYDNLLGDWNVVELQAMTWGGPRTEKLWYNYEIDRVHWASYAGKNFTDRQRIKRKAQRWGDKYRALPKTERLAVMAAMMEAEGSDAG
ncbi:MAG: DNA methylase [Nitrospirota bacterium]|nr:DNA methylase [Nitrospirota bacterium]